MTVWMAGPTECALLVAHRGGDALLRVLGGPLLCSLLATVVGTDVQVISLDVTAASASGSDSSSSRPAGVCRREFSRPAQQLRTHGGFAHPLLSADVKLLLPISAAQTYLVVPGSQWWVEEGGVGGVGGVGGEPVVAQACEVGLGSALLIDARTWRGRAAEPPPPGDTSGVGVDGDAPSGPSGPERRGGLGAIEVHYSKFANKQHAQLRRSVQRCASAETLLIVALRFAPRRAGSDPDVDGRTLRQAGRRGPAGSRRHRWAGPRPLGAAPDAGARGGCIARDAAPSDRCRVPGARGARVGAAPPPCTRLPRRVGRARHTVAHLPA
jgi:hypothetical protein